MSGWCLLVRVGRRCVARSVGSSDVIGGEGHVRIGGPGVRPRHARFVLRDGRPWLEALGDALLRSGRGEEDRFFATCGDVVWLGGKAVVLARWRRLGNRRWVTMGGLGSASAAVWSTWHDLAIAAPHPWPVLLQGESGTGKEVAARLVHQRSRRKDGPFVAINCGALPSNLVEAELFGSVKGAYTGANSDRPGAFVRAQGGTLFLDEIGELPGVVQAGLLRVLESGEVQVVGGPARQVDVRIIAATNVNLEEAVSKRRFRLDLLHRLAVSGATLLPVRDRGGDAALLLREFLQQPLPRGVSERVNRHRWPGNVRQIRNVARRVKMRCPTGALTPSMFAQALGAGRPGVVCKAEPPTSREAHVASLLAQHATVAGACRASGLPRSTFYRYVARTRRAALFDGMRPAGSVEERASHGVSP